MLFHFRFYNKSFRQRFETNQFKISINFLSQIDFCFIKLYKNVLISSLNISSHLLSSCLNNLYWCLASEGLYNKPTASSAFFKWKVANFNLSLMNAYKQACACKHCQNFTNLCCKPKIFVLALSWTKINHNIKISPKFSHFFLWPLPILKTSSSQLALNIFSLLYSLFLLFDYSFLL